MRFSIAGRAIVGSRSYQEDTWRVSDAAGVDQSKAAGADDGVVVEGDALVLVADGIGGLSGGAVASDIVAERFVEAFFDAEAEPGAEDATARRMGDAVDAANHALAAKLAEQAEPRAMGSTLIAALLGDGRMTFASVGDSLLIRLRDDEFHRVNEDHSNHIDLDIAALEADTPEHWAAALHDHQRMAITSALMGRSLKLKQVASRSIMPGDILILASDGLETLDSSQIRAFVRHLQPKGVGAVAEGLIKAISALSKGRNQDNTTVVVVEASKSPEPPSLDDLPTEIRQIPPEARKPPPAEPEASRPETSRPLPETVAANRDVPPAEARSVEAAKVGGSGTPAGKAEPAPAPYAPPGTPAFVRPVLGPPQPVRKGLDKRALALGLLAVVVIGGGLWMSGMLDIRRYFAKPDPISAPPSQVAPPAIVGPPGQARPAPTR